MPYRDREQQRAYQREWMRKRREKALYLLGGKCQECGSTESLEFDHVDPGTKNEKLVNVTGCFWSWSWIRILEELEKCQLLCYTHHKDKTREQAVTQEHGITMYENHGCRCETCRAAKKVKNAKRYA